MAFVKVIVSSLLLAVALGRPQVNLDDEEGFDPNPQYKYAYQVSDDALQTYIAHEENRDGENVSGQYSYVDPLGSLITVRYTAGQMGYTETRDVQDNFVTIRAQPASASSASFASSASASAAGSAAIRPVIQTIEPVVQNVVRQETVSSSSSDDSDLVARIISQLTPFIQETVSTSLGGRSTATTTTVSQARPISVISAQPAAAIAAPAPVRTVVAQPVQPVAVVAPAPVRQAASSVEGIFGVAGANNVRVETPNFNFAYDLAK